MDWLDVVLAGVMIFSTLEAGFLLTQRRGRQARVLPTVVAGLAIVGAWIGSRHGLGLAVLMALLGFSFAAHVVDLKRRW